MTTATAPTLSRRMLAATLAAAALAAPSPTVAVRTPDAPGPARYDQVTVTKAGPASARRVLILVPGFLGGAGYFGPFARDLVARLPGWQVWALDRRANALEDTSVFREGDPDKALRYYLDLQEVDDGRKFHLLGAGDAPYARRWGLKVFMDDLHAVVRAARRGGRTVALGGHSLGGTLSLQYASWDFGGRAGWRDLAALVCLDGGGQRAALSAAQQRTVRKGLAGLATGSPFTALLEGLPPESAGLFVETGTLFALRKPGEPAALQGYPLLPRQLRAPVRVTNRAAVGYAFDATTSPDFLRLIQVRSGSLAPSGDPRGWRDGERRSLDRLIEAFSGEPNGVEWYFPQRLALEARAASPLRETGLARQLGLRVRHAREVRLPLYGFQTSLSNGRLLRDLRRFVDGSRVTRADLVDRASTTAHLDPLLAPPARNDALRTLVPFLRRIR